MNKINKIIPKKLGRLHFFIGNLLVNLPVAIFIGYYFTNYRFDLYSILWGITIFFFFLWIILIIKRINDIEASKWWSLLVLVPLINLIFVIALFFIPGKDKKSDSI